MSFCYLPLFRVSVKLAVIIEKLMKDFVGRGRTKVRLIIKRDGVFLIEGEDSLSSGNCADGFEYSGLKIIFCRMW